MQPKAWEEIQILPPPELSVELNDGGFEWEMILASFVFSLA